MGIDHAAAHDPGRSVARPHYSHFSGSETIDAATCSDPQLRRALTAGDRCARSGSIALYGSRCGFGELHDVQCLSIIAEDYIRDVAQ